MAVPEVVPAVVTAQVRSLFCLRANRIQTQLHWCRGPHYTEKVLGQLELPDVAPETAICEVRDLGLGIDEEVCIDGVGDVQGRGSSGVRGKYGTVVDPAARSECL